MILTVYDYDDENIILAQFDDYKSLANYIGTTARSIQCYFAPSRENLRKKVQVKSNNKWVFIKRDYLYE